MISFFLFLGFTGKVASGLPEVKMPPFEIKVNNDTLYFFDIFKHVGSSILALPLISILESIAVAKAFCKLKIPKSKFKLIDISVSFSTLLFLSFS